MDIIRTVAMCLCAGCFGYVMWLWLHQVKVNENLRVELERTKEQIINHRVYEPAIKSDVFDIQNVRCTLEVPVHNLDRYSKAYDVYEGMYQDILHELVVGGYVDVCTEYNPLKGVYSCTARVLAAKKKGV